MISIACSSCTLLFSGCMLSTCTLDRATITPWEYAAPSRSQYWNKEPVEKDASRQAAKMQGARSPALPEQEDPLTLGELVDLALQNNTQTWQTWANARSAAAAYGQSQQNFFPTATATFDYQRTRSLTDLGADFTSGVFYLSQWGPQLAISYLIFDFGQTRATSAAALQALYNANLSHNRQIQTVIQTITTDYYNYLYAVQLLEAYEQDIADSQTALDAATIGLRSGVKDVSDVLQARSQLLQNQTEWVNQKQVAHTAFAQLLTDMGIPANRHFDLQRMPSQPDLHGVMGSVNDLIAIALQERYDLLAAEANLRSQQESLKAAKRQFFPTLNGSFNIGRTYYTGNINDDYDFTGQLSINWSIFNGFYNLNAVRQAKANESASKATLKQTQLQVIEDITTAHFNIAIARDAVKYTEEYLKTAEEQYRVSLSQYKVGTADILNVTTALTALATARAQNANALQQWYISLSTLAYATGIMYKQPIIGLP